MRIAFQTDRLRPNGGTRLFIGLGNGLKARGHDVHMVTISRDENLSFVIDFPVIEICHFIHNTYLTNILSFLAMPILTPTVDVVVGSSVPLVYGVFLTSLIRKSRGINFLQSDDVRLYDDRTLIKSNIMLNLYHSAVYRSFLLPLKVIANSQWTARQYLMHTQLYTKPLVVSPAFDPAIFRPVQRDPNDLMTVVAVARKHAFKGLNDILEALNCIRRSFKLILVSQDQLRVAPKAYPIEIRKPVDDDELAGIYRSADVFVHASEREGFGMPPLEAMACGVPIVLTDSGGVREFSEHEHNCLMSAPLDPIALARNIQRIMDDLALSKRLSRNGLATAQAFTWEKSTERFEKILMDHVASESLT